MTRKIGYHHFFIALGAILLGIALINVLVDPFGVFQLGSIAGFNQYKRQSFSNGVRALKSAQLVFDKYDLVILGSSRAEVGFSRDTPALKGLKTFNGGLPAVNIREIIAVMNFIRRHKNTKHIFIGLDFFSFNTGAAVHSDFPDSLFSDDNLASFYLKRALSWRALVASYLTAAQNYHGETCQVFEDGFAQWPLDRLPLDKIKRTLRQFIHSLSLYKRYKYESGKHPTFRGSHRRMPSGRHKGGYLHIAGACPAAGIEMADEAMADLRAVEAGPGQNGRAAAHHYPGLLPCPGP